MNGITHCPAAEVVGRCGTDILAISTAFYNGDNGDTDQDEHDEKNEERVT
jgi:hypothetical protein